MDASLEYPLQTRTVSSLSSTPALFPNVSTWRYARLSSIRGSVPSRLCLFPVTLSTRHFAPPLASPPMPPSVPSPTLVCPTILTKQPSLCHIGLHRLPLQKRHGFASFPTTTQARTFCRYLDSCPPVHHCRLPTTRWWGGWGRAGYGPVVAVGRVLACGCRAGLSWAWRRPVQLHPEV